MLTVLIADDDYRDRQGVADVIASQNWPTVCRKAENGQTALNILGNEKVDILITDICMPDMLGTDLAEKACELNPNIKIILVSAHKEFNYAIKAIHFGAINYLLKPYTLTDLINTVKTAIELCLKENSISSVAVTQQKQILFDLLNNTLSVEKLKSAETILKFEPGHLWIALLQVLSGPTTSESELEPYIHRFFGTDSICLLLQKNRFALFFRDDAFLEKPAEVNRLFSVCDKENQIQIGILYSRPIQNLSDVPEYYVTLKQMEDICFFASKSFALPVDIRRESVDDFAVSVPELNRYLEAKILSHDYEGALCDIIEFFDNLENSHHISSIYVKYTAVEILKEISRITNPDNVQNVVQEWVPRLFVTTSVAELNDLFKKIMEEIQLSHSDNANSFIIDQVFSIVQNEYMNNPSLDSIAAKLYITPSYLSRLFKQETGQNFMEYLKKYRLEKACSLLKKTNKRISQICREIGYESSSYFCALFKSAYGITPKQYRDDGKA